MANYSVIPDLLIAAIKANSTASTKFGDRIHYQTIPQTSQYPHCYIARTSRVNDMFATGENDITEDSYVIEVVARDYDEDLLDAMDDLLNAIEGTTASGLMVYYTTVADADDNYIFNSAESDALFLHAFQVTVYHE